MSEIPAKTLKRRGALSREFLSGDGIEVGALHHPLALGPHARVRYVDRYDIEGLRWHYPELGGYDLVPVDVVDDGETLSTFRDGELDFLIANHFLEHTENPIGTIRNHLRAVRPGGRLYFAVPNKHDSFDRARPRTPFEHLVADDRDGPGRSRADHYREWVRLIEKRVDPAEVEARVDFLMSINYSIHFHVWDARSFGDFLDRTRTYLDNAFDIEHLSANGAEIVAILKKRDPASPRPRLWIPVKVDKLRRFLSTHGADWKGRARTMRAALGGATRASTGRRAS